MADSSTTDTLYPMNLECCFLSSEFQTLFLFLFQKKAGWGLRGVGRQV
jgi:hypothetical protein